MATITPKVLFHARRRRTGRAGIHSPHGTVGSSSNDRSNRSLYENQAVTIRSQDVGIGKQTRPKYVRMSALGTVVMSFIVTENIDECAELLDAMSNEARLRILYNLSNKEMSVGALIDEIGMSQSALSQHPSKLRSADLVTTRRKAQTVYYQCSRPSVLRILDVLSKLAIDQAAED